MSDIDRPHAIPTVERRVPKPSGLLPKNTQAWIIGAIALVMVTIIALSGKKESKTPKTPPEAPAVVDPSQPRIEEYRARIEEQTRKLAAAQAQIAREGSELRGVPLANRQPDSGGPYTYPPYSGGHLAYQQESVVERQVTQIEADMKQREYRSLFASNIALTYRNNAQDKPQEASANAGVLGQGSTSRPLGYPYPLPWPPAALTAALQTSATPQAGEEGKFKEESL